ncbi:hypothetical protein BT69DRAFT_654651 [Atractiella rhizophila]|nr:hypothetical protein BT69DRAFT_654651 [Atractiella rhizophila]
MHILFLHLAGSDRSYRVFGDGKVLIYLPHFELSLCTPAGHDFLASAMYPTYILLIRSNSSFHDDGARELKRLLAPQFLGDLHAKLGTEFC